MSKSHRRNTFEHTAKRRQRHIKRTKFARSIARADHRTARSRIILLSTFDTQVVDDLGYDR